MTRKSPSFLSLAIKWPLMMMLCGFVSLGLSTGWKILYMIVLQWTVVPFFGSRYKKYGRSSVKTCFSHLVNGKNFDVERTLGSLMLAL